MDLFSISSIIVFLASISFALFLYHDNRKSRLNRAWFAVSATIAIWSLSLFGVTTAKYYSTALLWQYVLDISGILVPALILRFVLIFLKQKNTLLSTGVWVGTVALVLLSFTHYFKLGVTQTNTVGFFWIDPGAYYFLFPLFFITIALIVTWYLVHNYLIATDIILKGQIKYQLAAAAFGLAGGVTNFFPQLFNIYPFGNYFIILYLFFISYAIFRYKLIETKIIAAQTFTGALTLVLLFELLRSTLVEEWIIRFFVFIVTLGLSVVLIRSIQHEAEGKRELEKLTNRLKSANTRLKELDRQKSEFLSIATHQLRGPLAGIRGHLALLVDGSYGTLHKKQVEVIQKIFNASGLLAQTINDFLNVSRIEQGSMQYEMTDFSVSDLVEDIVLDIKPLASERKLTLSIKNNCVANECTVHADKAKISHIFFNLIDNAIKYTEKGWIHVQISNGKDIIKVEVSDSGVGISADEIGGLFQKFVRARGASGINVNGTGLGLYVAKQMVEAHGGKIWAESDGKGKGSTFIVELPTVK